MGWLDKVEGVGNLYIGGLYSLRRTQAVEDAAITHVVSVLRYEIDPQMIGARKHLQIELDDDEEENLLEYFPQTNKFIGDALDAGGSVFVHCAMGKSRSATVCIAYMMHKYHMSPQEALAQLRESRGVCEPNSGFMQQLEVYHEMNSPDDVEHNAVYQRWLYQRELQLSRQLRQAPEAAKIRFEDEHLAPASASTLELKCRKCRRSLATSQYILTHEPKQVKGSPSSPKVPPSACAHYFLEALSWMRAELEQAKVEGRLECPKCKNNVGKYAWQGMQCSCGEWVVPGISLAKGRVDEIKSRPDGPENNGIRMPPGQAPRRGPGQGNL